MLLPVWRLYEKLTITQNWNYPVGCTGVAVEIAPHFQFICSLLAVFIENFPPSGAGATDRVVGVTEYDIFNSRPSVALSEVDVTVLISWQIVQRLDVARDVGNGFERLHDGRVGTSPLAHQRAHLG